MGEGVPVTEHTNEHLSDDDADDFEICNSRNPVLGADFVSFPTCRPDSLKQRRQVTDGKEDVSTSCQIMLS